MFFAVYTSLLAMLLGIMLRKGHTSIKHHPNVT